MIGDVAAASDGGVFALFTSYRALRAVAAELRRRGLERRWPLFVQGDAPRTQILERFTSCGRGVLLGVASFWEGVDVPGDPLRALVITRLPFKVPNKPLTSARIEAIERYGGSGFQDYLLPHAALRLKRGFGRLIRTTCDRGGVVLLDRRVVEKGYGQQKASVEEPVKASGQWPRRSSASWACSSRLAGSLGCWPEKFSQDEYGSSRVTRVARGLQLGSMDRAAYARGDMRYETFYTIRFLHVLPNDFDRRLRLDLPAGIFEFVEFDEARREGKALVSVAIPQERISVRTAEPPLDGSAPQRGLWSSDFGINAEVVSSAIRILSFVTDIAIRHSSSVHQSRLVPESDDDEEFLASSGARSVYIDIRAELSVRSFSMATISKEQLDKLLTREPGLAIYAEALLLGTPTAQYRELWKILESGFGLKDDELLTVLCQFGPARRLRFSKDELRELLVLRGRASHAESKARLAEHLTVRTEIQERLARLKCLAEQVLLCKASWGTRGLGVECLAELMAFTGPDGVLTVKAH